MNPLPVFGALHCPAPSDRWLVPTTAADARVAARLLHNLRARSLHVPLRQAITEGAHGAHAQSPAASAQRALDALLPGNPKPVANLTRDPVVVALLLNRLRGVATDDELAFAVMAGLVFARATDEIVQAEGPRVLRHIETRRQLRVARGATMTMHGADLRLDGHPIDPWGDAWERHLEVGPIALSAECAALSPQAQAAWQALADSEVAATEVQAYVPWLGSPDEVRLGAALCTPTLDARALVLAAAEAKLALLRLLDPLVTRPEDEARFLDGARRAVARGYGFGEAADVPAIEAAADVPVTPFGAGLREELRRALR